MMITGIRVIRQLQDRQDPDPLKVCESRTAPAAGGWYVSSARSPPTAPGNHSMLLDFFPVTPVAA